MKVMHCKTEFDPATYEVIREAAYQARTPIRQWVARVAAAEAARATGLPLPAPPAPLAPVAAEKPADPAEANGTQEKATDGH